MCNHRFHSDCLGKWGDGTCPVCRYCQETAASASRCQVCSSASDLWICLICGHVGCGRYKDKHAVDHWQETSHCYALELQTQRVRLGPPRGNMPSRDSHEDPTGLLRWEGTPLGSSPGAGYHPEHMTEP